MQNSGFFKIRMIFFLVLHKADCSLKYFLTMLVIIVLKLKFASGQFQVCFFCSFLQEKKPSKNSWGEHRVAATLLLEVRHCFTKSVPLKCGSAMHLRAKNLPPYSSSFTMHYVFMGISLEHQGLQFSMLYQWRTSVVWNISAVHVTEAITQHTQLELWDSLCEWVPRVHLPGDFAGGEQQLLVATVSQDSGCSIPSQSVKLFWSNLDGFFLQSKVLTRGSLSWWALAWLWTWIYSMSSCSWDNPCWRSLERWQSFLHSSNPLSIPERHTPPESRPWGEAGALTFQQSAFPLDVVTLLKLLMLLKEKGMEKPSLIPRAERRKGACNCLCGRLCWGSPEGLPIAYYGIWFHPQRDCRIVTALVWLCEEKQDRWVNSSREIVSAIPPMPSPVSWTLARLAVPAVLPKDPLSLQLHWTQGLGASKNETFGGKIRIFVSNDLGLLSLLYLPGRACFLAPDFKLGSETKMPSQDRDGGEGEKEETFPLKEWEVILIWMQLAHRKPTVT